MNRGNHGLPDRRQRKGLRACTKRGTEKERTSPEMISTPCFMTEGALSGAPCIKEFGRLLALRVYYISQILALSHPAVTLPFRSVNCRQGILEHCGIQSGKCNLNRIPVTRVRDAKPSKQLQC